MMLSVKGKGTGNSFETTDKTYRPALSGAVFWKRPDWSDMGVYDKNSHTLKLKPEALIPPALRDELPQGFYLLLDAAGNKSPGQAMQEYWNAAGWNTLNLGGAMSIPKTNTKTHIWSEPEKTGVIYLHKNYLTRTITDIIIDLTPKDMSWEPMPGHNGVAKATRPLRSEILTNALKDPSIHERVASRLMSQYGINIYMVIFEVDHPYLGVIKMVRVLDPSKLMLSIIDVKTGGINPPRLILPTNTWSGWYVNS